MRQLQLERLDGRAEMLRRDDELEIDATRDLGDAQKLNARRIKRPRRRSDQSTQIKIGTYDRNDCDRFYGPSDTNPASITVPSS
jgi:hypothetical protein